MKRSRPQAARLAGEKAGGAHAVDMHVGRRIRERRQELAVSQEKLAAALGVTFQQVQKYELGRNRVSASRLWSISRALNVTPAYFFHDATPAPLARAAAPASDGEHSAHALDARELSELLLRLSPRRRRRILDMISAVAAASTTEDDDAPG